MPKSAMPKSATPKSEQSAPFLSVVIPAYNEETRLPSTIREIEEHLALQDFSWELVVVDDGSSDRTTEVAEQSFTHSGSRLLKNPQNLGKGATVRNGMLAARGAYRLFTDADHSTPIEELGKLLRAVEDGHDVAIGSRALKDSRVEVHQPFYRETMGKIFNIFVQVLAVPGIKDTQCGFKLFSREAADYIFRRQRMGGWCFDVELMALARIGKYRIAEVPVRWIDSPATRVRIISDPILMFLDLLRISYRRIFGWEELG